MNFSILSSNSSLKSHRSGYQWCSIKKLFLNISRILQHSQENTCAFNKVIKKETCLKLYEKQAPTQMFSCEYCKICKNNYFEEHL